MAEFNLLEFLKKQGADLAGLPADMLNLVGTPFVNAARNVSAVSGSKPIPEPKKKIVETGTSEDIRKRIGVPAEDSMLELLLSLIVPGPSEIAKIGGLGAAGLGIIKNSDAVVTHNTTLPDLLKVLSRDDKKLTNLSAAVTRGTLQDNFGSTTLLLRESAVDPAVNRSARLFSQDAYTTTAKDTALHNPEGDPNFISKLVEESLRTFGGKFGQRVNPGTAHGMQILASDVFTDFDRYLDSPTGYGRLLKASSPDSDSAIALQRFVRAFPEFKLTDASTIEQQAEAVKFLTAKAKSGDRNAADILMRFKTGASGYGELKLFGDTPLTADLVKAVVVPTKRGSERHEQYVEDTARFLKELDIPFLTYVEAANRTGMNVGDRNFIKAHQEFEAVKRLSEEIK